MLKKVLNYFVILTVALVSVGTLTACGDDDEDDNTTTQSSGIVGSWMTSRMKYSLEVDGKVMDQMDQPLTGINISYFEFSADGQFIEKDDEEESEGTWELAGGKLIMTYEENEYGYIETSTINCAIEGNKMTWTESEEFNEEGHRIRINYIITLSRLSK